MVRYFENQFSSSSTVKHQLPYELAIPLLGVYPGEMEHMSTQNMDKGDHAASFIKTQRWKQPKCPPTNERVSKMEHMYTMGYYSFIKRNLKSSD
jgi:hypothetical protein